MSYSLNSFKRGIYRALCRKSILGVINGDSRSLDFSSYCFWKVRKGASSRCVALMAPKGIFSNDRGDHSVLVMSCYVHVHVLKEMWF